MTKTEKPAEQHQEDQVIRLPGLDRRGMRARCSLL